MRLFRSILAVVLLGSFGSGPAGAAFDNSDFSNGLTSWTTSGDVTVASQAAVLGDAVPDSSLYQGAEWLPASVTIQFDFSNVLSPAVPQGTFPDVFFASLYFINDLNQFDLQNHVFDDAVGLFDLDSGGVYNLNPGGLLSASPLGPEWLRFTATLPNSYGYVIPVFELSDQNFVVGDSRVLVDNVTLAIPEPASGMLATAAFLAVSVLAFQRRRSSAGVE